MIVFGQLQTVFALAQLTGGPLYGRLGDVMGERTALIVAFTSSLVSYTLMGIATSVQMLFVSRLFSVFMHVMQGKTFLNLQICKINTNKNGGACSLNINIEFDVFLSFQVLRWLQPICQAKLEELKILQGWDFSMVLVW